MTETSALTGSERAERALAALSGHGRMLKVSVVITSGVFMDLVRAVESRAPLVHSLAHGAHHWRLVAVTGAELAPTAPAADALVVLLFALFHDSQRETEYVDPEHGHRAAVLARELVPSALPRLEASRLEMLCTACDLHTSASPTDEPTLGTCWDSDRLNLWRAGIQPSTLYLSTEEAKRSDRIVWSEELQDRDFAWHEIFEMYDF